jgi:2-succinyl-6-hydroxy-2,4-cyclohexadiene-1-carboxylate synthase
MTRTIDKTINYRILGNGYPVVFIHGFLESNSMWNEIFSVQEKLPFKAIQIELPGHGKSAELDKEPSILNIAKHLNNCIKKLNINNFSIVGHSMGGYVALELKKLNHECEKVVLLHSNFWEDSFEKKRDRLRVAEIVYQNKNLFIHEAINNLFIQKEKNQNHINSLQEEAKRMSANAIAYSSLAMYNRTDNKTLLQLHSKEILIIQGKEDKTIPLNLMNEMRLGLENQYFEIERAGHMGHIETPQEVKKILYSVFEQIEKGG